MARPRISTTCNECGDKYYAKGLCKPHYMAVNRQQFNPSLNQRPESPKLDAEDFWQFVKKELNIV